jgi:predicted Zn finger-like uncharacterized protein
MSLITQCPACGTLFKVVADQLKISEGWVRCGQCREVFDAPAHMMSQPVPAPQIVVSNPAADPVQAVPEPESAHTNSQAMHVSDAQAGPASQPHGQDFATSDWINSVNPPAPRERVDSEADHPPSLLPQDLTDEELAYLGMAPNAPRAPAAPAAATPTFIRQAQRAQRWRSPWVRVGLCALGLVLMVALGLQVAVQERNRIAAVQPRALPYLQDICRVVGCAVTALKQIESVVVDASGFNKLRSDGKNDTYKFTVNLKNTSALSLAVPYVELSLNDTQDQPVLRRVLNPADLGASQFVLSPSGEFVGSTTIQVDNAQLAGTRIAGYKVWAFYP